MEDKKSINYKDSKVYLRKYKANWELNPHNCFCCNKPIKNGTAILAINNHEYMPNILMHEECFDVWEDRTEKLFSDIERAWMVYKELGKIFH